MGIGCVVVGSHPSLEAIRMYFHSGHLWWEIDERSPVRLYSHYEPDRWYRVTCDLDWSAKTINVHIDPLGLPAEDAGHAAETCLGLKFKSIGCDGIDRIA